MQAKIAIRKLRATIFAEVASRIFRAQEAALAHAARARPLLLFGIRLWAAICLALYVAFWLQLDNAYWAGASAALVCQQHLGASLRKGWFRMMGTLIGAVAIVALTAVAPQSRAGFMIGLAAWGGICAFVATVLRNFASYAAALAGFTAAIIAGDELGSVGGVNGEAFTFAIARASEIWIGIVCASIVLAGTDLGDAPRRLANLLAELSSRIAGLFMETFRRAGPAAMDTQAMRHDLIRRVIALDPVFDEAIGESSRLRYHSDVLKTAMDGLFEAIAAWRVAAVRLNRLPDETSQWEADAVMNIIPEELRLVLSADDSKRWIGDPVKLHCQSDRAIRILTGMATTTPSQQLLVDQTTMVLANLSRAARGLEVLNFDSARPTKRKRRTKIYVPDWLPALVHATRAFVVIGVVEIFWIISEWPDGTLAITWASIVVIVFAARADQAYATSSKFTAGTSFAAVCAATVLLAVLPHVETFGGFAIVMALFFVPTGALMLRPAQAAIFVPVVGSFLPLLRPANQMSYDDLQFYNAALAVVMGCWVGSLSFHLLPPLSSQYRSKRLTGLTLRDLRRIAANLTGKSVEDWKGRMYSRLAALPDKAEALQRAQLVAALSVGTEIIELCEVAACVGVAPEYKVALKNLERGDSAAAVLHLAQLDRRLSLMSDGHDRPSLVARARGQILAVCDALAQHREYFETEAAA